MTNNPRAKSSIIRMRRCMPFRSARGFTAVEFMIVVVIVGIVLAMAAPSLQSLLTRHRLVTTTNALFMAINLARSEAIHRGSRVDLVPAGDGSAWTQGWIVFIDGNGNRRPDPGETIVLQHEAAHDSLRITPRFTDSKVQYLAFDGSGRTRTHASSQTPQSGHWLLEAGTQSRKIVIGFLGRPRVCNPQTDGSSC